MLKKIIVAAMAFMMFGCVGLKYNLEDTGAPPVPPPPPKGTVAELGAGTETASRVWSPADLATTFAGAAVEVQDEALTAANANGDTTHAPSQNAVIDYLMGTIDPDGDGSIADSSLSIADLTLTGAGGLVLGVAGTTLGTARWYTNVAENVYRFDLFSSDFTQNWGIRWQTGYPTENGGLFTVGTTGTGTWTYQGVDPGDVLLLPADPAAHVLFGFDNTTNTYKPFTIGTGLSFDQASSTLSSTGSGDDLGSAVAADIVALFNTGTCSGYLKSDGTCDTPSGTGDMTKAVYDVANNSKVDDADAFTPVDTADENATFYPIFVDGATGTQVPETDGEITYNPSTGRLTVPIITATTYEGTPTATGPQMSVIYEDSDNGSNYVGIGSPASHNSDTVYLLPTTAPAAGETIVWGTPAAVTDSTGVSRSTSQGTFITPQTYDADLTTWAGVTPGSGVATAAAAATNGAGGFTTTDGTKTLTNTTLDASGTGNVVKGFGYITLTSPSTLGSGVTHQTTATARVYGQALFANATDKATNYVEYILEVPRDLDTSVALKAYFKFNLGAADTADHDYLISMIDIADSADNATAVGDEAALDYTADATGASGDVETAGGNDLTGWAAALTPGSKWIIRIARDGDSATDASTGDSYSGPLTIRYGFTQ